MSILRIPHDYVLLMDEQKLAELCDNNLDGTEQPTWELLEQAEAESIEEMKSLLRDNYDVDYIFDNPAQKNQAPHPLIVKHLRVLTLYNLMLRRHHGDITGAWVEMHDQTQKWLTAVNSGKASLDPTHFPGPPKKHDDTGLTPTLKAAYGTIQSKRNSTL